MRDIVSPLDGFRSPFGARRGFSPASLFASGEEGAWYEPSTTTAFLSTTDLTPCGYGDGCGFLLDKSKGAGYAGGSFTGLGSELVTNGTFDTDVSGWTTGAGFTITWNAGAADINRTGSLVDAPKQANILTVGKTYLVSIDVVAKSNNVSVYLGVPSSSNEVLFTSTGTGLTGIAVATGVDLYVAPTGAFPATCTIDNISVRQLPGNHATQVTAGARPILARVPEGGRRNLLERTEEFDDAGKWFAANATPTPDAEPAPLSGGQSYSLLELASTAQHYVSQQQAKSASSITYTASVYVKRDVGTRNVAIAITDGVSGGYQAIFDPDDGSVVLDTHGIGNTTGWTGGLSGVVNAGNGWWRFSLTATTNTATRVDEVIYITNGTSTNYSGDGVSNLLIYGAQLETGSTATAYQKVVDEYDITEAGVTSLDYLSFDGVDDFLVTPTITPGTDKAQVFAGVRKLSDANAGALVEFSASAFSNTGSFWLFAPGYTGVPVAFDWYTRGSTAYAANQTITPSVATYPAPGTFVLTGTGDIAADSKVLRINGSVAGTNTQDQGTGNFLAYPIYIGRRGGTTLPFNGHIYSLVTRFGPNLDAPTISNTETYVAAKTGVTL